MADSPSSTELQQNSNEDMLELNKDLERMIEDVENISVQLTWMAYDMVVLRTSPELEESMRRLDEAYLNCRVAVCGEHDQEPEMDKCPEENATPQTDM
ncbi:synaptonemal complex central element protein 3 [Centroberyx affinis]|uniref:synaptonemal complex central element protein 3 n=1 Tax=Centroberyx affinis TaxID=166261 RepID=UPI003A5C66F6